MNLIVVNDLSKHFAMPKGGKKGNKAMKRMRMRYMQKMKEMREAGDTEGIQKMQKMREQRMKEMQKMRQMKGGAPKKDVIRAVDNISFEVNYGEIFGFLGPNGAGKTTTIRMLTGVLKPTKGQITIFGKNVWKNQIPVKQLMGHVPEEANVYMDLTGMRNLTFIGELYGISKSERIKRAEDLLKKFELFEKRNFLAKKYSKGMKQRLLLCMALMSTPKILFLDEPTQGLDVQSSIIIKKLIREYNEEGMTIFMTTHDMEVANELCNRIAIINRGKIIGLDTPENLRKLKQDYQAIDFYFTNQVDEKDLKELNSVKEVKRIGDYYRVIVENINSSIHEIMNYLKLNNILIKKMNTHEPSLEEVFIKMINGGVTN
jgi:ABC-2 type transport system ATP-binding protein